MFKDIIKEQIEVPSQMSYLGQIRDFIEKIGKKHKFSEKIINSFKLVVDESCTNIVRHGYRDIKGGKIIIRAIVRRRSLTVVLIDQGKSFDPRSVAPPDLKRYVEIGKKGGLGILMMNKLMDDIKYNITPTGNELRLTKIRDKSSDSWFKHQYDALSIKTKFTVFSILFLLITIFTGIGVIFPQIDKQVENRLYKEVTNLTKNFSEFCYEPLYNSDFLNLFKSARTLKEANDELIKNVFVFDTTYKLIALDNPIQSEEFSNLNADSLLLIKMDTISSVKIYQLFHSNEELLVFSIPVQLSEVDETPMGYASISIKKQTISDEKFNSKRFISFVFFIVLILGGGLVYVLISKIMNPFHKLADWVRLVGQGKVDEDEIDVDSSDELGEIAQAFNEMTSKFREAQVNLIEQQRMQKELQVAQEIQQMLLPQDFPNVDGFDIASYYEAAKEVGGDLFDFVEIDDHTIGIVVADVSGKGVPGSLIMTMIRTAIRLEARGNKNPAETLARVNKFVMNDMKKGMFVTMFYIVLDSRERTISFASAGHNPMILYRGKTRKTYYLNPAGFPVGIKLPDDDLFAKTIAYDRIQLHPDDLLVVYTDGITEAMNAQRILYAEERFLDSIRKHGTEDVVDFVTNTKDDIKRFTGGYEQNDDITMVGIKENLKAEEVKMNLLKNLFTLAGSNDITVADACLQIGVSTSTYYKYKKIYENHGEDGLIEAIHTFTDIESNHLSIEEKTKIYDVMGKHPTWGAKRISKELYSEAYGYTMLDQRKIYMEFIRAKLNTKEKRQRFVLRGGKKRLKAPGTPLLTLDGKVILADEQLENKDTFVPQFGDTSKKSEYIVSSRGRRPFDEKEKEKDDLIVEDTEKKIEIIEEKMPTEISEEKDSDEILEQKKETETVPEVEDEEIILQEKEQGNEVAELAGDTEEKHTEKLETEEIDNIADIKDVETEIDKKDENVGKEEIFETFAEIEKDQMSSELEQFQNDIDGIFTENGKKEETLELGENEGMFDIRKLTRKELREKLADPNARKEVLKQLEIIKKKKSLKSD